jgi:hypothetical protein
MYRITLEDLIMDQEHLDSRIWKLNEELVDLTSILDQEINIKYAPKRDVKQVRNIVLLNMFDDDSACKDFLKQLNRKNLREILLLPGVGIAFMACGFVASVLTLNIPGAIGTSVAGIASGIYIRSAINDYKKWNDTVTEHYSKLKERVFNIAGEYGEIGSHSSVESDREFSVALNKLDQNIGEFRETISGRSKSWERASSTAQESFDAIIERIDSVRSGIESRKQGTMTSEMTPPDVGTHPINTRLGDDQVKP